MNMPRLSRIGGSKTCSEGIFKPRSWPGSGIPDRAKSDLLRLTLGLALVIAAIEGGWPVGMREESAQAQEVGAWPTSLIPKADGGPDLAGSGGLQAATRDVWKVGYVDAPKVFDSMTDRSLALDADGHPQASGVYFYRLTVGGVVVETKRMVLLK